LEVEASLEGIALGETRDVEARCPWRSSIAATSEIFTDFQIPDCFFLKSLKYQRSDANCSEVFEMLLHDQVTLGQRAGGLGGLRPQLMW
jgi:hypothetical protein